MILNMRLIRDDRTARAVIRDEALRLFAERGPDAVGVREIAAAAGVSPALVLHHWGSKDGLRAGVDDYVGAVLDQLLDVVTADLAVFGQEMHAADDETAVEQKPSERAASLAQAVLAHLPPTSPLPAYLRRLWLTGDPRGVALMRRWYDASRQLLAAMAAAGTARSGRRPDVRAAVLMANDLAVLLLRDGLQEVLGEDPLGQSGLAHWTDEVLDLYRHGLLLPRGSEDAS